MCDDGIMTFEDGRARRVAEVLWDIEHEAHAYWEQLVTGDGIDVGRAMAELGELGGRGLRDAVRGHDADGDA